MSIALMTLAWKSDLPAGRKMVLLALCDNANDQGECFPSVSMIAQKCSMGQSTVKAHLSDLERFGAIRKEMRNGRSTIYHIDPARFQTSPDSAPRQNLTPTQPKSGHVGSQNSDGTQPKSGPITINEPSIEPSDNHQSAELPDWLPAQDWKRFCDYRKRASGKKWTLDAEQLNLKKLAKLRDEGQDPIAVIDESIANGWSGLFALKAAKVQQGAPPGTQKLGKAGQATAANAQRLLEKMRRENGSTG